MSVISIAFLVRTRFVPRTRFEFFLECFTAFNSVVPRALEQNAQRLQRIVLVVGN
jgi:hypothetical protein